MDERKILLTEKELRKLIATSNGLGMATCMAIDNGMYNEEEVNDFNKEINDFIESHLVQ